MKKLIVFLVLCGILTALAGCKPAVNIPETTAPAETTEPSIQLTGPDTTVPDEQTRELSFAARYIRTNTLQDGSLFPGVQVIGNLQQLQDYYTSNRENYDLERKEQVYADTTIGFLDACDAYDEVFFENNYLIFVLLEEGSGSITHQVSRVLQTEEEKVAVYIDTQTPEVGTCDMAQWHVIVELSRKKPIPTALDVQVYLDDALAWDGGPVAPIQLESEFQLPPAGVLITPEGQYPLQMGTCTWTRETEGDTYQTICWDSSRPLTEKSLKPVVISSDYAESVSVPVSGSSEYASTNMQGYLVKLSWEMTPNKVTYTCWPDGIWKNSSVQQETVYTQNNMTFYAKPGSYIYEIQATWAQGTANYYVYIVAGLEHTHEITNAPQIVEDPVEVFCGNTQTTLYFGEKSYTFMYDHSVTLTDILINLDYNPAKICKCLAEYKVDTEFGTDYGVNLTEGYARCEKGQADLTREQIDLIKTAIEWAQNNVRPEYTGQWLDKETAQKCDYDMFSDIVITEIYEDCFFARTVVPFPYQIKLNGTISEDWCVGDQVICTYENAYYDDATSRIEADMLTIEGSDFTLQPGVAYKPVIYLYPEEKTDVFVQLALEGKLTCTYPAYGDGWKVTAAPDGTLTDENGQTYNYLYWEGETNARWDLTQGFCVKGEDTAVFLEKALEKLGLNRREANEFIVFWLPMMEQNPYNIISFQTDVYTDAAKLNVQPTPDTLIRVFMAWQAAEEYVQIPQQELTAPERTGFTVVEWGGTEIN